MQCVLASFLLQASLLLKASLLMQAPLHFAVVLTVLVVLLWLSFLLLPAILLFFRIRMHCMDIELTDNFRLQMPSSGENNGSTEE
jgi:hypothetical protein